MTHRDFKAIAAALHSCQPEQRPDLDNDLQLGKALAWERCCIAVADALFTLNPRFRRDLFLTACRAP